LNNLTSEKFHMHSAMHELTSHIHDYGFKNEKQFYMPKIIDRIKDSEAEINLSAGQHK
jgi:hypothetical protein